MSRTNGRNGRNRGESGESGESGEIGGKCCICNTAACNVQGAHVSRVCGKMRCIDAYLKRLHNRLNNRCSSKLKDYSLKTLKPIDVKEHLRKLKNRLILYVKYKRDDEHYVKNIADLIELMMLVARKNKRKQVFRIGAIMDEAFADMHLPVDEQNKIIKAVEEKIAA